MKETVISWTIVNWVTVFLMVATMSIVLGAGLKMVARARNGGETSDD